MKARLGEKFGCVSRSVNSAFKSPSGRPTVVVTPFTPFLRFRAFHPLTEQKGEQVTPIGQSLKKPRSFQICRHDNHVTKNYDSVRSRAFPITPASPDLQSKLFRPLTEQEGEQG
ncbi:uncharacterized protein N7525_002817 [Penicillium rubens]|uniref:uncharacterized protein n=1 Tax=Penicillium rubens TaxID=1108849 RepID=UPI002A5A5135|nr:uncharacterized protein N7525_002817 [Penicillium rubens]KAJ5837629.1 hypothetical protein N7525_002817 [Penicillium rubens]